MRRVLSYGVGVPLVVLGGMLLLAAGSISGLWSAVRWLAGGVVVHDALLAPLTLAVGVLVLRMVPARARAPVQAALIITACLVLATLPLVLGMGRTPLVPSQQPLDYGRNLLLVLGTVWFVAMAATARRLLAERRRP